MRCSRSVSAPSVKADPVEHADYLEIDCLRQSDRNASAADLTAALGRVSDDLPEERPETDSRMEALVEAAFAELAERARHCGTGRHRYPFRVSEDDKLLEFAGQKGKRELYLFMLFATRMNMRTDKFRQGSTGQNSLRWSAVKRPRRTGVRGGRHRLRNVPAVRW